MDVHDLISELGYKPPSFITQGHLDDDPSKAHVFRRAKDRCGLQGVYALTDRGGRGGVPGITPVVYVCDSAIAEKDDPDELHRLVWNQNTTPFLVVVTASRVRLYPGFRYDPPEGTRAAPPIRDEAIDQAVEALTQLNLDAESIDEGTVWRSMGEHVNPSTRVDWHLLDQLRDLGKELRLNGRLPPRTAHALIGKYVYLRYLRDRGILSKRKLEGWGLSHDSVFGRSATLEGLRSVVEKLEEWLNGSIFPLFLSGAEAPSDEDVKLVASTFEGDEPRSGQTHLGFEAYDFSYIPIETLSNVYEQFLHAEREVGGTKSGKGRARQLGAYYTPVHLVDFILDELDSKRPLVAGMKVFDPACGSGAFLVQAYRRLVERERARDPRRQLTPARLRDLLVGSVFGVDLDEDACRVAHLSLSLTLLDYVRPPDLENSRYRGFRMPDLMESNIFHCPGGFFDPQAPWRVQMPAAKFDWIASNPPWRQLKSKSPSPEDSHVLAWMRENEAERPTVRHHLAEAFAWHAADFLGEGGLAGLLMPAMALFKKTSSFRKRFFSDLDVWCVVNLANLRRDLFAHRAEVPAAILFYCNPANEQGGGASEASILTYAPKTATQLASRPEQPHRRKEPWVIEVDSSEIKGVAPSDAATGDSLVWKAAMWGSPRDIRLIQSMRGRYVSLREFARDADLAISEGPQLRSLDPQDAKRPPKTLECRRELVGQNVLVMAALRDTGRIYSFPGGAFRQIRRNDAFVRVRGGVEEPLRVCRPPHVIADVSRKFAVYSDKFIVVPPRQIGIAGDRRKADLLKAIALLLSSDFCRYHDFMVSPQWGVHVSISTQSTLKAMPVPFEEMSAKELARWAALCSKLASADKAERELGENALRPHRRRAPIETVAELEVKLNNLVYEALGLDEDERSLVKDTVDVKLKMIESKWDEELHIRPASEEEMKNYARTLGRVLDEFLDEDDGLGHEVAVLYDERFAWITVSLVPSRRAGAVKVEKAAGKTARKLDEVRQSLRQEHGQWFYFNRALRVFEGRTTHVTKPRYRLAWLKSQALADADDLIADILTSEG